MPKLSATRTYADEQSPVQSDFDNFIDDIEVLVNTILLDDDNFQDGGITASSKLVDESITANQIRNNNVTTAKIADNAVTTSKLASGAVTEGKLAANSISQDKANILSGYLPPGSVEMFHTFNGTVSYPRGWMLCNGDEINETNYNAIHGAGTYTTDEVSSSPILNKTLPDMDNKYAVGAAATTQDGASAITSVGNTDHEIDIAHTHSVTHSHQQFAPNPLLTGTSHTAGATSVAQSTIAKPGVDTTTSSSASSSTQDIQPESVEFQYIMRVI